VKLTCNEQGEFFFFENVLTGEETYIYGYDVETKQQSSQWKSNHLPCPSNAWQEYSKLQTVLIVPVSLLTNCPS
jgi:hypothetical protein